MIHCLNRLFESSGKVIGIKIRMIKPANWLLEEGVVYEVRSKFDGGIIVETGSEQLTPILFDGEYEVVED